MVLGHEASGVVEEVGAGVTNLKVGDRVCMEPGIPRFDSRETLAGRYNLDPAVRFWATPPIHGCLRETVVHPAAFTFKLPDSISFDEGAMVEPLAIGLHAATIAGIRPGDRAVVCGAGTIGLMAAIAARAGGCGRVFITDIAAHKLKAAGRIPGVIPIDASAGNPIEKVLADTDGRGCELLFEATGSPEVTRTMTAYLAPGGRIVSIGITPEGIMPIAIVAAQAKEVEIRTIFRYAGMYPRAIELMASGSIDVRSFVTHRYPVDRAVEAFDFVKSSPPGLVKCVLDLT